MNNALIPLEKSLSVGSLGAYINWVNQIPLLSADEELQLADKLRRTGDLEAARKLVMSHLRLVVKMARGYDGYGLQQSDLIQEGSIGLMKAVKRFDPSVGVRLVSFAIHWIRAEMHEFILRNWRIVKIATTKAQRKLFFNLRKSAKKRGWFSQSEIHTIADTLNVSPRDVSTMEQRLNAHDLAFESSDTDDDPDYSSPAYTLEDHSTNPEKVLTQQDWTHQQESRLKQAIQQLDHRSRDILVRRWLSEKKSTLHDLADEYKISAERIRQLEKTALNKLKSHIQAAA
ncbi:MAG: RNA polymerase sigma factor RpoH [Coxiellaceae bacterium]|nr:RNA polymerase sigma factor RpoH [Coxiellaceae bacterium]|tara:strand:+ start:2039 stop:2896 length:858 start_codon:yes stop_codon:yes gene_type:complete